MKTLREQLEDAAKDDTAIRNSPSDSCHSRVVRTHAFIAGALFGARLGFEAAREVTDMFYCEECGTRDLVYSIPDDFLKELK